MLAKFHACMPAKFSQSCLTLCNPKNCSLPGSSVQGFSRQEYWSGLLCPPPGDLPIPGIEPTSLMSPALIGRFFTTSVTWEALVNCNSQMKRHKAWRLTFRRRKKKWKLKFLEASKTLASVVIFYFQSGYLYQVLLVPGKWHIAILELTNCNIRRTVCF